MKGTSTLAFRAVFSNPETCSLQPLSQNPSDEPRPLRIYVLFTEMLETTAALRSAGALSTNLPAKIALVVPLIVPYPLPLEEPPVSMGFVCRRIRDLAAAVAVDIEAYVYLCRDSDQAILDALSPASLVVIGSRHRWPFEKSRVIARKLRRRGHHVVLADF